METVIFYLIAAIILVFSVLSVTSRRILRAAVFLLFALCGTAGLYFLFNFYFLAAVQLTVYAGGIVVLVIFSILLTSRVGERLESPGTMKALFSGLAAFAGALLTIWVLAEYDFTTSTEIVSSNMDRIGGTLLSYGERGYVLPFEVISVLLLAAMIGAIIIAKKQKPEETNSSNT